MVYLESIRFNRRVALRNVVSGQRVPVELTSLGQAYLAVAPEARRKALFNAFRQRRGSQWPALATQIQEAIASVHQRGFCAAAWQPEVVAISTPLPVAQGIHVLNVSVSTAESTTQIVHRLSGPLLSLQRHILQAIVAQNVE